MTGLWKVFSLLLLLQLVDCTVRRPGRRGRTKSTKSQPNKNFGHFAEEYIDAAKEAKEGDHPYLVQLRDGKTGEHFCGGSILSKYLVITAASCVYNQSEAGSLDGIEVVAGEHDRNEISGHEQVRHIWEVFIHESYIYSKHARDNDIALLVIQPEFNLNDFVQMIPIASNNFSPTGHAVLSGWGKKHKDDRNTAQVLHSLNLTFYNDLDCKESWGAQLRRELGRDVDITRILCARHNAKYKTATKLTSCDGDAGSPLICTDFTNYTSGRFLCGIVSGSDRSCGQFGNKPGIFANVRKFFPWITDKLNQVEMTYGCPCGYFRCNNQHCIDPKTLNDGNDNCGDESDETPGIRALFNNIEQMRKHWDVEDTKYKCHYNKTHPNRFRLISSKYVCDGIVDCPGNTPDICESLKQNPSICPSSHKEATRPHSDISNCKHITDETNCQGCKVGSTKCLNIDKCILNEKLCDGIPNCQDGSDEKNCTSCSSESFHCPKTQTCTPSSYRCDGLQDCPNGEDEESCDSCKPFGFLCQQERKCIPDYFRCDTKIDCSGGVDEKNCTKCLPHSFLCKKTQKCIRRDQRCDGNVDCDEGETTDESDETKCTYCSRGLFHCPSENKCTHPSLRCNGEKDCQGGEDETNCSICSNNFLYLCRRMRKCIAARLRCDKKNDCLDNEDEEDCTSWETSVASKLDLVMK